jgi:hypothetical protein
VPLTRTAYQSDITFRSWSQDRRRVCRCKLWLSNYDSTEAMTDHSQYDDWLNAGGPQADRSRVQVEPSQSGDVFSRTVADSWSPVPTAPGSTGCVVAPRTAEPGQAPGPAPVYPPIGWGPPPRLPPAGPPPLGPWAAMPPPPQWSVPPSVGPRRRRKGWVIALSVGGVLLVAAVLCALAVPTFLTLSRDASGASLFEGAVPSNWTPWTVSDLHTDELLEGAWRTPGPGVDGFYPCVYVVRFRAEEAASTAGWFANLAAQASSQGWDAQTILLPDGAQAFSVYVPWSIGRDRFSSDIPISEYLVYAVAGTSFYRVTFMTPVNDYTAEAPAAISIVDRFQGTSGPGPATTLPPVTTVPGGTSSVSPPATNPPATLAPVAPPSGAVPNSGLAVVSVNAQTGWATFESDSSGYRRDVRYQACPRYFTSTQNGDGGLKELYPGDFVGLEIDAMTPTHCMVDATVWAAPSWPQCQATGPGSVVMAKWVTANQAVQSVVYTPVGPSQPTVANHWCRPPIASTLSGSPTAVARIRPGATVLITLSANQWVTEVRVVR